MPPWAVPSILLGLNQTGWQLFPRGLSVGPWAVVAAQIVHGRHSLFSLVPWRIRQIPGELRVDQKIVQLTITESGIHSAVPVLKPKVQATDYAQAQRSDELRSFSETCRKDWDWRIYIQNSSVLPRWATETHRQQFCRASIVDAISVRH